MSSCRIFNKSRSWSLGIIDSDNVDLSNIHRQSLYDIEDLKKPKVSAAKKN